MRLACDVGGTFTDLVVDCHGRLSAYKAPTTPDDPVAGVLDAIGLAATACGEVRARFLARANSLTHATTLAINAVLTGRTALLTTEGHRDVLLPREGGRLNPYDMTQQPLPPCGGVVPRPGEMLECTCCGGDRSVARRMEGRCARVECPLFGPSLNAPLGRGTRLGLDGAHASLSAALLRSSTGRSRWVGGRLSDQPSPPRCATCAAARFRLPACAGNDLLRRAGGNDRGRMARRLSMGADRQRPNGHSEGVMRIVFCAMFAQMFLLCGIAASTAQVQGQWTATGFMQSPREDNVQLRLNKGGVLSVGGFDNSGNILASAELYDPATGTWQLTGSLRTARETFAGAVLSNGKVLVVGGVGTGATLLGSAELYDPATGAWAPAGTLAVPRYGHTATLLTNGRVLVAGGCAASGCGTLTAVSELYNPATNAWTTTGSLGTGRTGHTAVRLKTGRVMAIDGFAAGVTASCEIYDPATGTWSAAASTNVAREQHGTTLLPDGKVLVTGGVISKYPMNSAELYEPVANTWTLTANMVAPRYAHTSTLLPDGTVLLAGGEGKSISCGKACTGFIPTASAEIFNEAAGGFTATTGLNRALAYHSTTLLSTGRALTAGGEGYNAYCCQVVSDAEFYTPLTLTFSASALDFGVLQTGLTSPAQTITVSNLSGHASRFKSISAGGDYAQTNTCPTILGAGQTCAIMVSFAPTAAGTRTGAVTLKDNDPGSPTQTITLSAIGETTTLGLVPGALDFGSVTVGSSSVLSATLVNDGAAAVTLTAVAFTPRTNAYTQTNDCPATLGVQLTCTVSITFTPPDVFTYPATLSATGSAGGATEVKLTGTGTDGGGG